MLYNIISLKTVPEVVFAHIYSCPNYRVIFQPMVPNIEIAYIEAGAVEVEMLGKTFTVEEKSFLIMPRKYEMSLRSLENTSHIHYTVSAMVDAESVLVDESTLMQSDRLRVPVCLPYCAQTESLHQTLRQIIQEYQKGDSISHTWCGAMVARLLCDIARAATEEISTRPKSGGITDVLDGRIKKYIHHNLDKKITLADLAECTGKNPNYLNQLFRKKNDMSIISYVNLMKMRKVASLIVDAQMTLKEAAKEVGITDGNYLSRLFKSTMGMTISEFKENSVDYSFNFSDYDKIFGGGVAPWQSSK